METHPLYPPDLFAGTAEHYARFRVPYPREMVDDLLARVKPSGHGRLLDLACGTGEVALRLHGSFHEVWAVDQEPDMISVARRKADECGARNVRWQVGRAEDIEAPPGYFELVTIGSAFHRLDRRLVAERCLVWLASGRCLVELGCNAAWHGTEPWQRIAAETIRKWTMGDGEPSVRSSDPRPTHEAVLESVGFEKIESHRFPTAYTWTLDSFIGYLRSTGKAARVLSGDHGRELEADVRSALLSVEPTGQFRETVDFYYILAVRPETPAS